LEKGQEIGSKSVFSDLILAANRVQNVPEEERSDERALAVRKKIEEKEREEGVGGWLVRYWAGDA
jgi:hypothetical protein